MNSSLRDELNMAKPYACDICQMRFTRYGMLAEHKLLHTDCNRKYINQLLSCESTLKKGGGTTNKCGGEVNLSGEPSSCGNPHYARQIESTDLKIKLQPNTNFFLPTSNLSNFSESLTLPSQMKSSYIDDTESLMTQNSSIAVPSSNYSSDADVDFTKISDDTNELNISNGTEENIASVPMRNIPHAYSYSPSEVLKMSNTSSHFSFPNGAYSYPGKDAKSFTPKTQEYPSLLADPLKNNTYSNIPEEEVDMPNLVPKLNVHPTATQYEFPLASQYQFPLAMQYQFPLATQYLATQYQFPMATQYQFPMATQYQFPLATQYQFPLATQYQFSLATQHQFPLADSTNMNMSGTVGLGSMPSFPLKQDAKMAQYEMIENYHKLNPSNSKENHKQYTNLDSKSELSHFGCDLPLHTFPKQQGNVLKVPYDDSMSSSIRSLDQGMKPNPYVNEGGGPSTKSLVNSDWPLGKKLRAVYDSNDVSSQYQTVKSVNLDKNHFPKSTIKKDKNISPNQALPYPYGTRLGLMPPYLPPLRHCIPPGVTAQLPKNKVNGKQKSRGKIKAQKENISGRNYFNNTLGENARSNAALNTPSFNTDDSQKVQKNYDTIYSTFLAESYGKTGYRDKVDKAMGTATMNLMKNIIFPEKVKETTVSEIKPEKKKRGRGRPPKIYGEQKKVKKVAKLTKVQGNKKQTPVNYVHVSNIVANGDFIKNNSKTSVSYAANDKMMVGSTKEQQVKFVQSDPDDPVHLRVTIWNHENEEEKSASHGDHLNEKVEKILSGKVDVNGNENNSGLESLEIQKSLHKNDQYVQNEESISKPNLRCKKRCRSVSKTQSEMGKATKIQIKDEGDLKLNTIGYMIGSDSVTENDSKISSITVDIGNKCENDKPEQVDIVQNGHENLVPAGNKTDMINLECKGNKTFETIVRGSNGEVDQRVNVIVHTDDNKSSTSSLELENDLQKNSDSIQNVKPSLDLKAKCDDKDGYIPVLRTENTSKIEMKGDGKASVVVSDNQMNEDMISVVPLEDSKVLPCPGPCYTTSNKVNQSESIKQEQVNIVQNFHEKVSPSGNENDLTNFETKSVPENDKDDDEKIESSDDHVRVPNEEINERANIIVKPNSRSLENNHLHKSDLSIVKVKKASHSQRKTKSRRRKQVMFFSNITYVKRKPRRRRKVRDDVKRVKVKDVVDATLSHGLIHEDMNEDVSTANDSKCITSIPRSNEENKSKSTKEDNHLIEEKIRKNKIEYKSENECTLKPSQYTNCKSKGSTKMISNMTSKERANYMRNLGLIYVGSYRKYIESVPSTPEIMLNGLGCNFTDENCNYMELTDLDVIDNETDSDVIRIVYTDFDKSLLKSKTEYENISVAPLDGREVFGEYYVNTDEWRQNSSDSIVIGSLDRNEINIDIQAEDQVFYEKSLICESSLPLSEELKVEIEFDYTPFAPNVSNTEGACKGKEVEKGQQGKFKVTEEKENEVRTKSCIKDFITDLNPNFERKYPNKRILTRKVLKDAENQPDSAHVQKMCKRTSSEYHCFLCSKSFCTERSLKSHMFMHSNFKISPHKCKHCRKSFSYEDDLLQHEKSHEEQKPFQCDVCYKFFSRKDHLRRHSRNLHSGDEVLKCEKCQEDFYVQDELNVHLQSCVGLSLMATLEDRSKDRFESSVCVRSPPQTRSENPISNMAEVSVANKLSTPIPLFTIKLPFLASKKRRRQKRGKT